MAAELHGHRGARGLLPENTLPAFEEALKLGVDCLEMDIGMSKDGRLIVSHDPRLNKNLVRSGATWVTESLALKDMTAAEIRALDVGRLRPGSGYARRYETQRPIDGSRMPFLEEVLGLPGLKSAPNVCLNIEIKTTPKSPNDTFPPERIADALLRVVRAAGMAERLVVQSFHWTTLAHIRKVAPDITLSFLTAEQSWLDNVQRGQPGASPWLAGLDIDDFGGSIPRAVKSLGGRYWSVYYGDLTEPALKEAHGLGLKVLVWTVNDVPDMKRFLEMGVDGIITDYPDRALSVMKP